MNKMYSGKGDDGFTAILSGERVPKYDLRPEAYGVVDEAQAAMGVARSAAQDERTRSVLLEAQRDLQHLMTKLAAATRQNVVQVEALSQERVEWLENIIDELGEQLPPLQSFVIPGDSPSGAALHLARTIVRRAERRVVRLVHNDELLSIELIRYLNRLSSLLFVLARWEDIQAELAQP